MSIRLKLIAAFAFSMALLLILGIFVLSAMHTMSEDARLVNEVGLPAVEIAASLQATLYRYRINQWEHVSTSDPALREQLLAQQRGLRKLMDEQLIQYSKLAIGEVERRALRLLEQRWGGFASRYEQLAISAGPGADLAARTAVIEPLYLATAEAAAKLRQLSRQHAVEATALSAEAYDTGRSVAIAALAIALMFNAVVGFSLALDISDGLKALRGATQRVTAGDLCVRVPSESEDELGALGRDFQQMTAALLAKEAEVARQQAALVLRAEEADQATLAIERSLQERDRLIATVRAMASPVLPVHPGVVIAPLIGLVDHERADDFRRTLLSAVERQRSRSVIIDVTGLAVIDAFVARALLDVAVSLRLLGARTILVGIRPELAQTLVSVGVNLEGLVTLADLQSGVRYAIGT